MDLLKKIFPFAFKDTKTNNGLIISIMLVGNVGGLIA